MNLLTLEEMEIEIKWKKGSFSVTDSPIESYDTHIIAEETKSFLNKYKNDSFSLWVSIPDPHEPYEVPRIFFFSS